MKKFIPSSWKAERIFPVLIFVIGLVVRLDLSADFDGLYGQDSFAYYQYGRDLSQAELPDKMYWPMGFPLLLAGIFSLAGMAAEAAQMGVVVAGALTGGLTYLLVNGLLSLIQWPHPRAAALVSALLVTFSGQVLQSSVVIMADIPALCWAVFSAWCLARYARTSRRPWILVSALTVTLAGITRWVYLLLVLPWTGYALLYLKPAPTVQRFRDDSRPFSGRHRSRWSLVPAPTVYPSTVRREAVKNALFAAGVGLLILLPQLVYSRQNPAALENHGWLQNWSLRHATQKDFVTPDGTFHYSRSISHFYARAVWDGYFIHWIMLPLMIIGVLALLYHMRQTASVTLLLSGWIGVEYGFLIGIPYQNIRFSLAFFVPLTVLAGIGISALLNLLNSPLRKLEGQAVGAGTSERSERYLPKKGRESGINAALLFLILSLPLYSTYTAGKNEIHRMIGLKNADLNTIKWVQQTIPEGDIYTLDLWLMMQHYAPELHVKQIYYETPESLAQQFPSERPSYVLLNLWAIENQWVGKAPWIAYHWLNDHQGLTRIGRYGNYTLLRVEGGEE